MKVSSYLKDLFDFNGYATRGEFWYAYLGCGLFMLALGWVPVVGPLLALFFVVPLMAITCKRLRDVKMPIAIGIAFFAALAVDLIMAFLLQTKLAANPDFHQILITSISICSLAAIGLGITVIILSLLPSKVITKE